MRAAVAIFAFLCCLLASCAPRTQVQMVNPGMPGRVDTVMVREVVMPNANKTQLKRN